LDYYDVSCLAGVTVKNSGKPNKVVHIITGLNEGGAEAVLTDLCLHGKKVVHVVISLMDGGKYGSALQEAGTTVYCLGMNRGKPSLIRFYRLIKLIKAEQPDVVQTWMYHADLLGGIAARVAGVKTVFWGIHNSILEKGKSKRSTILISRVCALFSRVVPERIICCANKAAEVHAKIGYHKPKLVVIQNGYDLSRFRSNTAAGRAIRGELGFSNDEFVLGMVGRFDPYKDHSNLLKALARVVDREVFFRCLLVGKGLSSENSPLTASIAELGLEKIVMMVGQRADIPAVMNALDLHVLSSSSEGFPNVLAEAMACGTPCVSTNVGDAMEILGDAGLCCPVQNPRALADLIIKMAKEWQQNPTSWQARKKASAQRISARFSIEGMVDAYEACWFGEKRSLT
jgi:glycosyltransferase involved in cell wall biosynthesis